MQLSVSLSALVIPWVAVLVSAANVLYSGLEPITVLSTMVALSLYAAQVAGFCAHAFFNPMLSTDRHLWVLALLFLQAPLMVLYLQRYLLEPEGPSRIPATVFEPDLPTLPSENVATTDGFLLETQLLDPSREAMLALLELERKLGGADTGPREALRRITPILRQALTAVAKGLEYIEEETIQSQATVNALLKMEVQLDDTQASSAQPHLRQAIQAHQQGTTKLHDRHAESRMALLEFSAQLREYSRSQFP